MAKIPSGFGPTAYPGPVYPVLPHSVGVDEHEFMAMPIEGEALEEEATRLCGAEGGGDEDEQ